MTFSELTDYISCAMHRGMQHVYQRVRLKTILRAGGRAKITSIAEANLAYDQSQVKVVVPFRVHSKVF